MNTKIVQYGTGRMSKYTMRYALEQGMEIVGAFDINPNVIGQDISTVMDTSPTGIIIEDSQTVESRLQALRPDIVIITTMSLLKDVEDILLICARNGINAITTCEEAFFSYNSSPALTTQINELALANNCTITGCGYQDFFWGNMIYALAGTTHKITKIIGSSSYNVEDYGIALAKAHGAGLNLDQFATEIAATDNISPEARQELINKGEFLPSYMWNAAGWLADRFGLHITSITQTCLPQTYSEDLTSKTLEMTIPAGSATGMEAKVTATTKEGVTLEVSSIGKVYAPDEVDTNDWTIEGEPSTRIVVERPNTVELTCANIINRIPDILVAESGFVPTSRMPYAKYQPIANQE